MFVSFKRQTLIRREMVKRKAFLVKPNVILAYPNVEDKFMVANHKKNEDHFEYPCFFYVTDDLYLYGKWWKEKLFL